MFTAPVESVTQTRIFARSLPEGRQVLVYRMALHAKKDVAMVLPIPVKSGTGEKAVSFVDLSGYPEMFTDMEALFQQASADPFASAGDDAPAAGLAVQRVGAFEASYVPTVADFARLDERFRMPAGVWDRLPFYSDYSFVVFKFRPGNAEIHPMAFAFPRRDPARLFFPTVHVHDGQVHGEEEFGHLLYCQKIPGDPWVLKDWQESPSLPSVTVDAVAARGIVDPRLHVFRRELKGRLPNADTVLT